MTWLTPLESVALIGCLVFIGTVALCLLWIAILVTLDFIRERRHARKVQTGRIQVDAVYIENVVRHMEKQIRDSARKASWL